MPQNEHQGRRKIPVSLESSIMEMVGDGKTASEICVWLNNTHGITIHEAYMGRKIQKIREARAKITEDVLRAKLETTLTKDLDRLEGAIVRAHNDELIARTAAAQKKAGAESWVRLHSVARGHRNDLMRGLEVRLKLAGADLGNKQQGPVGVILLPPDEE